MNTIFPDIPNVKTTVNSSYGCLEIAATYCGIKHIPHLLRAEWQHGWLPEIYNSNAEMVVGSDGLSHHRKKKVRYLVARQDQKDALRKYGYEFVEAIGLPPIYLNRQDVSRRKDSILIMPSHTLSERDLIDDGLNYRKYIERFRDRFTSIGLCLHNACKEKGQWTALIEIADNVIEGADEKDINSLYRLGYAWSSYEFVTTNSFGSHVPYAAYFGAKVSVNGPEPAFSKEDCKKSVFYRNCPTCLDLLSKVKEEHLLHKAYPQFIVDPDKATDQIEWAKHQIGEECKKKPADLRKALGWTYPAIIRSAFLQSVRKFIPKPVIYGMCRMVKSIL